MHGGTRLTEKVPPCAHGVLFVFYVIEYSKGRYSYLPQYIYLRCVASPVHFQSKLSGWGSREPMQMRSLACTPSAHMRIPGKVRPGACHDVSRCCCTCMIIPGAEQLISTEYVYRRSCFNKIISLCVGSVHAPQDMYVFKKGF